MLDSSEIEGLISSGTHPDNWASVQITHNIQSTDGRGVEKGTKGLAVNQAKNPIREFIEKKHGRISVLLQTEKTTFFINVGPKDIRLVD